MFNLRQSDCPFGLGKFPYARQNGLSLIFRSLLVVTLLWLLSIGQAYAGVKTSEPPLSYGSCEQGKVQDNVNSSCYEKCPAGNYEKPSNGMCYEKCKDGFTLDGNSCKQIQAYRKTSYTKSSRPIGKASSCYSYEEKSGLFCFSKCSLPYVSLGNTCQLPCTQGYSDSGEQCLKTVVYNPKQTTALLAKKSSPQVCADQKKDTLFPIVLVHGFGGWGGGAVIEHMMDIKKKLEAGGATVLVPSIPAFENNTVRGQALLSALMDYRETMHIDKFHLIGHSQGAPAARFAAARRPEWVASVTSVGGVNWGTEFADQLIEVLNQDGILGLVPLLGQNLLQFLSDINFGKIDFNTLVSNDKGIFRAAESLSTRGMASFNKEYPAGLGVDGKNVPQRGLSLSSPLSHIKSIDGQQVPILFYSWTGHQPFQGSGAWLFSLDATAEIIRRRGGGDSDGLVPVSSATFGYFLGAYNQDHLAEINFFSFTPTKDQINPVSLWCEHAVRLKEAEQTYLVPKLLPYGFNPKVYVSLYPDLINSGVDGTRHYLQYGRKENRRYR